jgi:pimeloyl-ACP methyl ester carboxylesterase
MGKDKDFLEEYVQINGIDQYFLHYPSSQKEVIIHLHGGPGSSATFFAYTLKEYRELCNIVYYDQRGAGRTQRKNISKPDDLTIDILIEDLKQVIIYVKEKYQTDRIILMGQSWGTVLGTQYVLKYPEDVICYIGTGHCIDTRHEMQIIYNKLKDVIENKGNKKDLKKLLEIRSLPTMNVDDKNYITMETRFFILRTKYGLTLKIGKLLKIIFKSPIFKLSDLILMINGPKANIELMKWLTDYTIWETTKYSVPVYYLLGTEDWQVPSTLAAEYFERINNKKKGLYWIENAGHATDADNPKDFINAVKEIILQISNGVRRHIT